MDRRRTPSFSQETIARLWGKQLPKGTCDRSTIANYERLSPSPPEQYCDWLDEQAGFQPGKGKLSLKDLRAAALADTGREKGVPAAVPAVPIAVLAKAGPDASDEVPPTVPSAGGPAPSARRGRPPARAVLLVLVVVGVAAVGLLAGLAIFSGSGDKTVRSGDTTVRRDDFSNPSSGWERSDDENELAAYANGNYRVVRKKPGLAQSTAPWVDLPRNLRVEVQASKAPEATGSYGVYCRSGEGLHYAGLIDSATRRWKVGKVAVKGQALSELKSGKTGDIRNETNHIALECSGAETAGERVVLRLFINGENVSGDVVDEKGLPPGEVGVEVTSGGSQPVDVSFDDFVVLGL